MVDWRIILSGSLLLIAVLLLVHRRGLVEEMTGCSCPEYDQHLATLDSQVAALKAQVNGAISDTKDNLNQAQAGLAKLNGD